MRTTIFNIFTDLPSEFKEDFRALWELSPEQRLALIPKVVEAYKTVTLGQQREVTEKAVAEIGGNTASLLRVIKTLLFIYQQWDPLQDDPDQFLKDLSELNLLPADDNAIAFMLEFLKEIQKDNVRRLKKIYSESLLPSYIGCQTVVDFRAIVRNPFASKDPDERIENYKPDCVGFEPVILIKIKRDSGNPADFEFQADEDRLKIFLDSLNAGLKELIAAKACWPVENQ